MITVWRLRMYKVSTALTNSETNNTPQLSFIQVVRLEWIVHMAISVGTLVDRRCALLFGSIWTPHFWNGILLVWHLYIWSIYISQLIRYSWACGSYQDFLDRGLLLTGKLLNQGFLFVKLKSSLRKFFGRHDLVDRYGISVSQITTDMFHL